MTTLYRYERDICSMLDFDGVFRPEREPMIRLITFNVRKETKCYYYIRVNGKEKKVSKTAIRTYAYDTQEKAFNSFRKRCRRCYLITRNQYKAAKRYNEFYGHLELSDLKDYDLTGKIFNEFLKQK